MQENDLKAKNRNNLTKQYEEITQEYEELT